MQRKRAGSIGRGFWSDGVLEYEGRRFSGCETRLLADSGVVVKGPCAMLGLVMPMPT